MKILQNYYKRVAEKLNKLGVAIIVTLAVVLTIAAMVASAGVEVHAAETSTSDSVSVSETAGQTASDVEGTDNTSSVDTTTVHKGYISVSAGVKVYSEASTSSSKVGKLKFNKKIKYTYSETDGWVYVCSGKVNGYIKSDYISSKKVKASAVTLKGKVSSFKSYMSRAAVGSKSSPQYKLQKLAKVGKYGITTVNGRYCIAVGSGVGAEIGQYVDLVLENGTVIKCIVGDHKASKFKSSNGCVSEFIVSVSKLASSAKSSGSVSSCQSDWNSPVKTFVVYDKKVNL